MSDVSEALEAVLDGADPWLCARLAAALGAECADLGGTPSAEECEGCVVRMVAALLDGGLRDGDASPVSVSAARVEAVRLAGWLQGFAASVWLLPSLVVEVSGMHLVDEEACAEYERNVARLGELLEEWR